MIGRVYYSFFSSISSVIVMKRICNSFIYYKSSIFKLEFLNILKKELRIYFIISEFDLKILKITTINSIKGINVRNIFLFIGLLN